MAGSRVLSPPSSDPDMRIFERVASLEARLAALESKRDMKITTWQTGAIAGTSIPSVAYNGSGGRLWILGGGHVYVPGATARPAAGVLIAAGGGAFNIGESTYVGAGQTAAIPLFSGTVGASITAPGGTIVFTFEHNDTGHDTFVTGFFIEWPQA